MELKEKLTQIAKTSTLPVLSKGRSKDLDEFWENFVEPLLPPKDTVEKWHKILKEYVDEKNNDAVFFMRAYGSPSGNSPLLRRGFYNTTDYGFSAFYGDNFFTAYFYSMAYDGFVPKDVNEFKVMMQSRMFPCGCIQTTDEKKYAAYFRGTNPGLTTKGYKIAHIYSSGKEFNQNAGYSTIGDFCAQVFPRGENTEWYKEATDQYCTKDCPTYHYRYVPITSADADKVRKFLVAHFIRTVHPLNYFLVPKEGCVCWKEPNGKEHYEIGEHKDLIQYVACKIRNMYSQIYDEFLEMIYPDKTHSGTPINNAIDIEYQVNKWSSKVRKGTLIPDDEDLFKQELIAKGVAWITYYYADGTQRVEKWKLRTFNQSSDLWNNINSRINHRKDKSDIERAVFEIK